MGRTHYREDITFYLDGQKITLNHVSPDMRLIDYLHLPEVAKSGTKLACGQGGCGACTVMLTDLPVQAKEDAAKVTHRAINACLRPLAAMDGTIVTTTQGIGSVQTGVDDVQWTIALNNGSQCGFCTPGFVMNMFTRMQKNTKPSMKEVENLFDGNLCRCTGYRPIIEGFKTLAKDFVAVDQPEKVCIDPSEMPERANKVHKIDIPEDFAAYMRNPQPLCLTRNGHTYYRPVTKGQIAEILVREGPIGENLRLVGGNTGVGIYPNRAIYAEKFEDQHCLVDVSRVPELLDWKVSADDLTIGGQRTLSQVIAILDDTIAGIEPWQAKGLSAFKTHLGQVANLQVRNVGSIAGNIALALNKGFVSDVLLVLATLNATLLLHSKDGDEEKLCSDLSYPSDTLSGTTVIMGIRIPFTSASDHIRTFKIRRRKQDAHAIVNAGFFVALDAEQRVANSRIFFNGIDADYKNTTDGLGFRLTYLKKVSDQLHGRVWNTQTYAQIRVALQDALELFRPPQNASGQELQIDQIPFESRKSLAASLFYKFYDAVLHPDAPEMQETEPYSGEQRYNSYPENRPVSEPYVKLSAFMQATGEATYTSDIPAPAQTLEAAFVYSIIARGTYAYMLPDHDNCTGIDEVIAHLRNQFDGFEDVVAYRDIAPSHRSQNWGGAGLDDPLFVPSEDDNIPASILAIAAASDVFHPDELTSVGAPIALVLARTHREAQEIADYIRVNCIRYEPRSRTTFNAALKGKHYFPQSPSTNPGITHVSEITRPGSDEAVLDMLAGLVNGQAKTDLGNQVFGEQNTGFQNHFYMEPMIALAVPGQNRDIAIHVTTQNLPDDQRAVAAILGLKSNDVRVKLYREGGGFGGRQSRARFVSAPAAIAAQKHTRPVRLRLSRETNSVMCGNRHPYHGSYATQFRPDGKIDGMMLNFVSDGGNTYDLSFPVMDLSVLSAENVYGIDTFKATGQVCQTNQISSTAFRAFGLVQSMNILEESIEHTAFQLGMLPEEVREQNLYPDGQVAWSSFLIDKSTIAMLRAVGLGDGQIEQLEPLKGQKFLNETALEKALAQYNANKFLGPANLDALITLKNFSTQSYAHTPYLTGLKWNNINRLWQDLKTSSDIENRRLTITAFNAENRYKKRGLSMMPLKYGISFNGPRGALNQAGAYVIAYAADGSVLVHHGGVEMGQGLQTKMAQVAARTLGIPIDYIKMAETDTNVIADSSATAASTGSDLNGGAVQKACKGLRIRLEKMCEDLEEYAPLIGPADLEAVKSINLRGSSVAVNDAQWQKIRTIVRNWRDHWKSVWPLVVEFAYTSRINLAESARYKAPHHEAVDHTHPVGRPFFYFTYAVAVSEVEIDVLTGEFETRRSDILFDVGKSLNPLIDVGQIEGGFVQGMGYLTTEELTQQDSDETSIAGIPEGAITSLNTWGYKPPASLSIPRDFRVTIFDDSKTPDSQLDPNLDARAVMSSKGIGEPPLVLANTVFFAIKQAILALYQQEGLHEWPQLTAPATTTKIQDTCRAAFITPTFPED